MHLPQFWQENRYCCFHCNFVKKKIPSLFLFVQWRGYLQKLVKKKNWVFSRFHRDVVRQATPKLILNKPYIKEITSPGDPFETTFH